MSYVIPLYLFVDRDRQEMMSNSEPYRALDFIETETPETVPDSCRFTRPRGYFIDRYDEGHYGIWYTDQNWSDYGEFNGTDLSLDSVYLPKGFIKHLTGKEITENDKPICWLLDES